MWTTVTTLEALDARRSWGPAAGAAGAAALASAPGGPHPLVPIGQLVVERRTFLEPSRWPDRTFNFLGLEHIRPLTGELVGFAPRLGQEVRSRAKVFLPGDVLYGRLRPYLNKAFLAEGAVGTGICSTELYVLVADPARCLPRYLRWMLASPHVHAHVASLQTGSTLPRLPLADLLALEIPLPPLDTQRRLESYLVEQESRIRSARARAEWLPGATLDGLLEGIAGGGEPSEQSFQDPPAERFDNPLPGKEG